MDVGNLWEKLLDRIIDQEIIPPEEPDSSSKLALEEARRLFDEEEEKRRSIENKIGILLTIDTILVSLIIGLELSGLLPAIALMCAVGVSVVGLLVFIDRPYKSSMKFDQIKDFAEENDFEANKLLLKYYPHITSYNAYQNEKKRKLFRYCVYLTILAVILLGLSYLTSLEEIIASLTSYF